MPKGIGCPPQLPKRLPVPWAAIATTNKFAGSGRHPRRRRCVGDHRAPPGRAGTSGDEASAVLFPAAHGKIKTYPRALFPDSYCAQAGPSEGASRGVVKRDRLAVAAHGCNRHTQRAAVQAARSRRDRFGTANTGRRSRPRPPFRFDAATHRHDMALLWSVGCSNMSLSRKQAQTGAMLHRGAPSLGWRAWNAYATIQARSSMKTERPIGATRN